MPIEPTTRRSVLAAAAWSAPVVVVATAAPAFAASTTGTLTVSAGSTRYGDSISEPGLGYSGVMFNGFTITPSADSAGPLTLTVTPTTGRVFSYGTEPDGWERTVVEDEILVFVGGGPLTAGTPVSFGPGGSEGVYFDDDGSGAPFTLTFSAPGLTSVVVSYGPSRGPRARTAPGR